MQEHVVKREAGVKREPGIKQEAGLKRKATVKPEPKTSLAERQKRFYERDALKHPEDHADDDQAGDVSGPTDDPSSEDKDEPAPVPAPAPAPAVRVRRVPAPAPAVQAPANWPYAYPWCPGNTGQKHKCVRCSRKTECWAIPCSFMDTQFLCVHCNQTDSDPEYSDPI